MYQRLTRIGPLSFGLLYGIATALFFLIFGLIGLLVGPNMPIPPEMAEQGMGPGMMAGGGVVGVLIGSLIGFVLGMVMGVLGAIIYNMVASVTGGIKMRFEGMDGDDF